MEEQREADRCAELTGNAREELSQCTRQCDVRRDAQLEGYNEQCSNGHAGTLGARVAVVNNTNQVRFLYLGNTLLGRMDPGEQTVFDVPCGQTLFFDFKATQSSDALYEERSILQAYPCCEEQFIEPRTVIANE